MMSLVRKAFLFGKQLTNKNIASFAASCAFFFLLSLFPTLILLSSLLPYTGITEDVLVAAVNDLTPDVVSVVLLQIITEAYSHTIGTLSLSIIVTIWSAGTGMLGLIRGLNAVYDVKEYRNYFHLRLIASFYTLALLLVMVLSLFLLVFGRVLRNFIVGFLPHLATTAAFLVSFRYAIMFVLAVLLFSLLYYAVPNVRLKFSYQIPGAMFTAVAWGAFSTLFSFYVNNFNNYSAYGSLATLIILMLWLYVCMYLTMLGAFINKSFQPAYELLYTGYRENRRLHKEEKRIEKDLKEF